MNIQQLQDALGELPEELIASTAHARQKKKVVWGPWVAVAACACFMVILGATVLPAAMYSSVESNKAAPTYAAIVGIKDELMENSEESMHVGTRLLVQVMQVRQTWILVSPVDNADQLISVPVKEGETYVEGDKLWIAHSGVMRETWPLEFEKIYSIERVKE